MKIKTPFLFIMIVLLFLGACNSAEEANLNAEPENAVEAAEDLEEAQEVDPTPRPTDTDTEAANLIILADGNVVIGKPLLPMSFETSGKLLALNVEPGQTVAEGEMLATLDDEALQDSVKSSELRVSQAKNSLIQSEAELQRLLDWSPDEQSVAIAQANIESAQINLTNAQVQDDAAGSSLTSVNISVNQAQRELADAQAQFENVFSEGREWEVFYDEPICETFQGVQQCQNYTYAERIKDEREAATNRVQFAQEQLQIARANYNLEASRVTSNSADSATVSLTIAEQELARALKGPTGAEIAAAELNVEQSKLALEQEEFALEQAQSALEQSQLIAPWPATILSVDATTGGMVAPGTPILTLLDSSSLEFHTTNLSERDLSQISIGQTAEVILKAYSTTPLEGSVKRIGLQSTGTVGDAAIFPIVIQLENIDPELEIRAGMTGRVELFREE
ncbi:MAG: HlyD family efflux transporter periplasmic adaptor subunit [Chloroflexota bacterium]